MSDDNERGVSMVAYPAFNKHPGRYWARRVDALMKRALVAMFGKQMHEIFIHAISNCYNARAIDSAAMHIIAAESGHVCGRPGYSKISIVDAPGGRLARSYGKSGISVGWGSTDTPK